MGSDKDMNVMQPASDVLTDMGVEHEVHVMSAHRNPEAVSSFARAARDNGFGAIICGAGKAAHLAGAVAALTTIPVIGVPIAAGALKGIDALYATVQMPTGIPVATVAIDSAANAAYLAASILSLHDEAVAGRLATYRQSWTS
ncbi:MAG TPA: 5-(carboxyamino)imidazole ribonucleotide mutase [Actinobacteria bacterium]|nr:5-(carboxyamino)imidazole ribonucleotide mutase [Actinomycetota bacterium]